jgi:hypothetical protein
MINISITERVGVGGQYSLAGIAKRANAIYDLSMALAVATRYDSGHVNASLKECLAKHTGHAAKPAILTPGKELAYHEADAHRFLPPLSGVSPVLRG